MKQLRTTIYLFFVGATLYPLLELLFRGYSHISMSLLGGICLVAIDWVNRTMGRLRPVWKAALCSVLITQMEFITGMVVNVALGLKVWDYSHLPFQLAGQVCLLFSFFWFLLSYAAIHLLNFARRRLRNAKRLSPSAN